MGEKWKYEDYEIVLSDELTEKYNKSKYIIVNGSGKILDNKNGIGYNSKKTARNAYEKRIEFKTSGGKMMFVSHKYSEVEDYKIQKSQQDFARKYRKNR